jgi:hypothetical protein
MEERDAEMMLAEVNDQEPAAEPLQVPAGKVVDRVGFAGGESTRGVPRRSDRLPNDRVPFLGFHGIPRSSRGLPDNRLVTRTADSASSQPRWTLSA